MKKVMVFGVFDGLHDGHFSLFRQARRHGDHLIVVVTQDHVVERLKGRLPEQSLAERIDALKSVRGVNEVALGDAELGAWAVLFDHLPDVVAVGYDQTGLENNLKENMHRFHWKPKVKKMKAHQPERLHSSIIKKSPPDKGRR